MRVRKPAIYLALFLFHGQAIAQSSYQPRLEGKLKAALEAARRGECPKPLMTPLLGFQCRQQIDKMAAQFINLGDIRQIEFQGTQSTPSGPAEAYLVRFESGQMFWLVNTDADGKLQVLWSPG